MNTYVLYAGIALFIAIVPFGMLEDYFLTILDDPETHANDDFSILGFVESAYSSGYKSIPGSVLYLSGVLVFLGLILPSGTIRVGNAPKPLEGLICIVGCLHGDEPIGGQVVEQLQLLKKPYLFVIGNEEARKRNVRFIESDLNRSFPGDPKGKYEEKLAAFLLEKIKTSKFLIDIHSTIAQTESFVIITRLEVLEFAKRVPLQKIIFMKPSIASGKALIDQVSKGISLEFAHQTTATQAALIVEDTIKGTITEHEYYEVYGLYKGPAIFENFKEVTHQGETFIPILSGAKSYGDMCFKAKKVAKLS